MKEIPRYDGKAMLFINSIFHSLVHNITFFGLFLIEAIIGRINGGSHNEEYWYFPVH